MMFKVNPALVRDTITGLGPSDYKKKRKKWTMQGGTK